MTKIPTTTSIVQIKAIALIKIQILIKFRKQHNQHYKQYQQQKQERIEAKTKSNIN